MASMRFDARSIPKRSKYNNNHPSVKHPACLTNITYNYIYTTRNLPAIVFLVKA